MANNELAVPVIAVSNIHIYRYWTYRLLWEHWQWSSMVFFSEVSSNHILKKNNISIQNPNINTSTRVYCVTLKINIITTNRIAIFSEQYIHSPFLPASSLVSAFAFTVWQPRSCSLFMRLVYSFLYTFISDCISRWFGYNEHFMNEIRNTMTIIMNESQNVCVRMSKWFVVQICLACCWLNMFFQLATI